jgi:hypothetical protein
MGISTIPFKLFEEFETMNNGVLRKRSLKFDINALADFEQETGMGFGQLFSTKAIFATARAMLWAGLKHEDRGLTIDKVGELISTWIKLPKPPGTPKNKIDEVLTACFTAAKEQGAFGDPDELEGEGGSNAGNAPKRLEPLTIDVPQANIRPAGEPGSTP